VRGAEPPWVQRVLGDDSELARAEKVACSEWRKLREFEEHSSKGKNYDDAKWASDRLKNSGDPGCLEFPIPECSDSKIWVFRLMWLP